VGALPLLAALPRAPSFFNPRRNPMPAVQRRNLVAQLFRNANRLHRLLDDLLDLNRLSAGRLTVHPERHDLAVLVEPEVADHAREATQRRTGWWLRNGFKIKVVHTRLDLSDAEAAHQLLPKLYGDRGRAFLMGPHPASLRVRIGLFHRPKE
jgi:signal transduction histidine kinase